MLPVKTDLLGDLLDDGDVVVRLLADDITGRRPSLDQDRLGGVVFHVRLDDVDQLVLHGRSVLRVHEVGILVPEQEEGL